MSILLEKWTIKHISTNKIKWIVACAVAWGIAIYLFTAKDANGAIQWNISSAVADYSVSLTEQPSENSYYVNQSYVTSINSPLIEVGPKVVNQLAPTLKIVRLPGDENPRYAGQCVIYVRYITGLASYSGNAIEWKKYINSYTPQVGSVIVMRVGRFGHLGVVQKIQDDTITVRSRNWEGKWIVSDDEFNVNDLRIVGYINY